MAAPIAAGSYAILRASFPKVSPDVIEQMLEATGVEVSDEQTGAVFPSINLYAAYSRLAEIVKEAESKGSSPKSSTPKEGEIKGQSVAPAALN